MSSELISQNLQVHKNATTFLIDGDGKTPVYDGLFRHVPKSIAILRNFLLPDREVDSSLCQIFGRSTLVY